LIVEDLPQLTIRKITLLWSEAHWRGSHGSEFLNDLLLVDALRIAGHAVLYAWAEVLEPDRENGSWNHLSFTLKRWRLDARSEGQNGNSAAD